MSTSLFCDMCLGVIGPGREYIRIEMNIERTTTKDAGPSAGQEGTGFTELQILRDYHVECCPSREEMLAYLPTTIVRMGNPDNVNGRQKDG